MAETTQTVIAAQFNQHPARLMLFQQSRKARQPCCEVSPLMLALITDVLLCHLSFNKAGQAALADIRYPAPGYHPESITHVCCGGTEG